MTDRTLLTSEGMREALKWTNPDKGEERAEDMALLSREFVRQLGAITGETIEPYRFYEIAKAAALLAAELEGT